MNIATPHTSRLASRIRRARCTTAALALIATVASGQTPQPTFSKTDPYPLTLSARNIASNATLTADIPLAFPSNTEIYLFAPTGAWIHAEELLVDLYWPPDAPTNAQVLPHLVDWDHLWYQKPLPTPLIPGHINQLRVALHPSSAQPWEPRGHNAAWNLRALMDPKDLALRLFCPTPYTGTGHVQQAVITWRHDTAPPAIYNVRARESTLNCYRRFELTFDLPDRYPNPFDTNAVTVTAIFTGPDNTPPVRVAGFYSRDFTRTVTPAGERILPAGRPHWKVRFCPATPGNYRYQLQVRDPWGSAEWGPGTFTATATNHPGFVRASTRDPRRFECDNGSAFSPIGDNIRSPFEKQVVDAFPKDERWLESTLAYGRHIENMGKQGKNHLELWTGIGPFGLEWLGTAPGYHGIGQYNLQNAWALDRLFEQAEASGVRISLVIDNHGKFAALWDSEWHANPFNIANGGYLRKPEEYFTDPRAIQAFQNLMHYTIARWASSPSLFAWQLWNAVDLTGSSTDLPWHRSPECINWHRAMGRAVKTMDPYRHLVGTHFSGSYRTQNTGITALPEMDYTPLDAWHESPAALAIVDLIRDTASFNASSGKPVLITDMAANQIATHGYRHINLTLHAGLWASTCIPVAGTSSFWWWPLVNGADPLPPAAAVRRFSEGNTLIDASALLFAAPYTPTNLASTTCAARITKRDGVTPNTNWRIECFGTPVRAQGWIYNVPEFESLNPTTSAPDPTLAIRFTGMSNATYEAEFWDTIRGAPIQTNKVAAQDTVLTMPIPPVTRDIAFKLRAIQP
jgi:hypothetical protein